jgi:serine/threonine-protein kinase
LSPTLLKESDKTDFLAGEPPIHEKVSVQTTSVLPGARFTFGSVLSERYRIIALLGRGGMGEVYRADDLKLRQTIALKLLPKKLADDGAALARFHREVRIARQVSHPNVCRVFDIGDVEGQPFLTMEYIDGEDLSSLLRRIGRLPQDKAIEIARQLCAGLASAHNVGVLHRDLKPANIMIDGRGCARITDFGLAVVLDQTIREDELAGTPAYMAPEQLRGDEVTSRSDIYALGLVLYELFTGKRVFESNDLAEQIVLHESSSPTNPSSLVKGLDPLVERTIMRCLEKEPSDRPSSAIQVAAALPGGDPLQAALLAGELPSPEMVAAAGGKIGIRPRVAVTLLVAVIVTMTASVMLAGRISLFDRLPLEIPPEAMAHRSREVISQLGYPEKPGDAFGRFENFDNSYLRYLNERYQPAEIWDRLRNSRPVPIHFHYRESPVPLIPRESSCQCITWTDPPRDVPEMKGLVLDSAGNIRTFYAVPPRMDSDEPGSPIDVDWNKIFALSGLNLADFRATQPVLVPEFAYETHLAWLGIYSGQPELSVRVEAASRRGKVVQLNVLDPWDVSRTLEVPVAPSQARQIFIFALMSLVLVGAGLLARNNWRTGIGDRRGALRLSIFTAVTVFAGALFGAHNVMSPGTTAFISQSAANALFYGGIVWLLFISLEPLTRRRWPAAIITWSRLLEGRLRDPMVGRDVLIGVLAGLLISFVFAVIRLATQTFLGEFPITAWNVEALQAGSALAVLIGFPWVAVLIGLIVLFLVSISRLFIRSEWLVAALLIGIALMPGYLVHLPRDLLIAQLVSVTGLYFVLIRWGFLSFVAAIFVSFGYSRWLFSTGQLSAWYAGGTIVAILVSLSISVYTCHISLGGQRLIDKGFFGD